MKKTMDLNAIYVPSDDVVAREIEGELIIVPLTSGVGDMEDELYTLNETGRAIWDGLDGKKPLKDLIAGLASQYAAPADVITKDVTGLMAELLKRRMIVARPPE
ncbi:MAG: PqqD family protein [Acidobacteriota bacterium]|nr:PqqD family protein [Acidobacteriota bacterium]